MKLMIVAAALVVAIILLNGCARDPEAIKPVQVVEKKVPVIQEFTIPMELKRTKIDSQDLPVWIPPSDPAASSCLAPEGEKKLVNNVLVDRESKLDAFEKLGVVP